MNKLSRFSFSLLILSLLIVFGMPKEGEVKKNETTLLSRLEKAQDVVSRKAVKTNRIKKTPRAAAKKVLPKSQSKPVTASSVSYRGSDKFGFCDGFGRSKLALAEDIQDTKALGFLWSRPLGDVFAQDTIEKNGVYNFSVPDSVVKEIQRAGIKIFGTVFPTGMPKIPNSIDTASFAKYVKAIVERYKGQITYWEVGIEPFCQTPGETCYKNFFELVKTAYQAAKSVDPSIKISPGGPAPIYDMNGRIDPMGSAIFEYFFKNGGDNYMDFFNFHYLVGKEEPGIAKYIEYWRQYVPADKEIWLSETGSRDVGDRFTISSDAAKEADWVKKHISDAFQSGISKVFWCRAEHSFSDMPEVVQALQEMAKKYGGNPRGSVVKRKIQGSPQGGIIQQQENMQQQQPREEFQQPGGRFQHQGGQGYCGDGKCDSIEQQTGGCPIDCR